MLIKSFWENVDEFDKQKVAYNLCLKLKAQESTINWSVTTGRDRMHLKKGLSNGDKKYPYVKKSFRKLQRKSAWSGRHGTWETGVGRCDERLVLLKAQNVWMTTAIVFAWQLWVRQKKKIETTIFEYIEERQIFNAPTSTTSMETNKINLLSLKPKVN